MELHTQETQQPQSVRSPGAVGPPKASARCCKRSRSGGRCRLPVQDLVSGLCFRHAALARKTSETLSDSVDLTAELLFVGSTVIETAESINIVLTNLVEVVAKGRISSRRAAVLSYALSLLLRSVVAMDLHNANTPPNIVWDAPRPIRDPIPFPANAPAEANPKPADSPATGEEPSFQEKFDAAERYSRLRT